MTRADLKWWGEFSVPEEQWGRWQIGPLSLWARPMIDEWRLAWHSEGNAFTEGVVVEIPAAAEPDPVASTAGYALQQPGTRLQLAPRLADLPVVVRPDTPLWIPPGQRAALFVSTIVWVVITAADTTRQELMEIPVFRPSDTWFGSNTRHGEMCYASKTRARIRADMLGRMPHRAITPVEIANDGEDSLNVEQLRIPVTALSLYESPDAQLWTSSIRFTRQQGPASAELDILSQSIHVPDSRKIADPRTPLQRNSVIRAFGSLFE